MSNDLVMESERFSALSASTERDEVFRRQVELLQSRQRELDRRLQLLEESERALTEERASLAEQHHILQSTIQQLKQSDHETGKLVIQSADLALVPSMLNEVEISSFESQVERLQLENKRLRRALCEIGRLLHRDA